jgi:hypothetical protein
MKLRFQADADLNQIILHAVLWRSPRWLRRVSRASR